MRLLDWGQLGERFAARTIMTPRDELMCWDQTESKAVFCDRARQRRFDVAPILGSDAVVGVLLVDSEQTEPLAPKWLVAHDTGIPNLLSLFASSERSGLFVFQCQDVVGLVNPGGLEQAAISSLLLPSNGCSRDCSGSLRPATL